MRKIYLLLLAPMLGSVLFAQNNVVNGSFENWEDSLTYSEPVDWNTNNQSVVAWGEAVLETADAHTGSSAAMIRSVMLPDSSYIGGFLTNGTRNPDSLGTRGWQINYRPDKLTGYYKYTPAPGDTARIVLYLNQYDDVFGRDTLIATGNIRLGAANTYTYFEIPVLPALPDIGTDEVPDSYVILIMSTRSLTTPDTSVLIVDNLNFIEPVSAPVLISAIDVNIFPNPVEDYFVISSPKHRVVSASVLSTEGRQVQHVESATGINDMVVNTNRLSKGFYYVQIRFDNGVVETRFITVVK